MSPRDTKGRITVLGTNPMGTAVTARLRANGYDTTVWNHTAARTVTEAVAAGDIILTLLDDDPRERLQPAAAGLAGKILVNLAPTTPRQARDTAAWAAAHRIAYLQGSTAVTPAMIGKPDAPFHYAGDENTYALAHPVLDVLGKPRYLGADPALAAANAQALPASSSRSLS